MSISLRLRWRFKTALTWSFRRKSFNSLRFRAPIRSPVHRMLVSPCLDTNWKLTRSIITLKERFTQFWTSSETWEVFCLFWASSGWSLPSRLVSSSCTTKFSDKSTFKTQKSKIVRISSQISSNYPTNQNSLMKRQSLHKKNLAWFRNLKWPWRIDSGSSLA